MSKHSPGPFVRTSTLRKIRDCKYYGISTKGRFNGYGYEGSKTIALVENDADADLFSAGAELLFASKQAYKILERLLPQLNKYEEGSIARGVMNDLAEAINKAEPPEKKDQIKRVPRCMNPEEHPKVCCCNIASKKFNEKLIREAEDS